MRCFSAEINSLRLLSVQHSGSLADEVTSDDASGCLGQLMDPFLPMYCFWIKGYEANIREIMLRNT